MVRPVKEQGIVKVKDQEQQWEASQLCPRRGGPTNPWLRGASCTCTPSLATWGPWHIPHGMFLQGSPTHLYPLPGPTVTTRAFIGMPSSLAEAWPVKRVGKGWAGTVGLNPRAHRGAGLPCHFLPEANTHGPAFHQGNTGVHRRCKDTVTSQASYKRRRYAQGTSLPPERHS